MSENAMRLLLQARLATLGWATQTAWENVSFTPTVGVAYQEVTTEFGDADAITLSDSSHLRGVFQVRLLHPNGVGVNDSDVRAKQIKAAFPRNLVLSNGEGKVKISRDPRISPGGKQGDRNVTVIRIRFSDR